MSDMGMFGHVPTPEDVGAKAFVMGRELQAQWSWPAYVCGLSDAGAITDAMAVALVGAACAGELGHNGEEAFDYELAGDGE